MSDPIPPKNSLVLYKNRPAVVLQPGDKIDIQLEDGSSLSVRPKDIALLHPGPLPGLQALQPQTGEVAVAWELLAGDSTTLPDLAELIYEQFTPATAWATWQLVEDGLYFEGDLETVRARLPEEVEQTRADRAAKKAEQQAWAAFLERIEAGQLSPEDDRYLTNVELLALGRHEKSRVMRELGQTQSPENAHALLLSLGYWDETVNPYPARFELPEGPPEVTLPALPDEARVDLTHLPAFAIDDADSRDPDDAISLDGERLWVHIADVAALVTTDSPADLEARARGANLYLPEGTVPMLPPQATHQLGLGLADVSPALSFGLELDAEGKPVLVEVVPSRVRVQRLTYAEAQQQLDSPPLAGLLHVARQFQARRQANDAIELDLPEVKVRVEEGQVVITPLPALASRDMVREAMLMTGEAVARFAQERDIPLLFSTQDAPEPGDFADTLSGNFARLRTLSRSQLSSVAAPHAGLGLAAYAQTTSPLRRYADLVIHQQLRAHLRGAALLTEADMLARVGAAEAVSGSVRQAERLSNKHWTLVYLRRRPNWEGTGVLVESFGRRHRIIIPELALESRIHLRQELPLDSEIRLALRDVDLPELEAYFRVMGR